MQRGLNFRTDEGQKAYFAAYEKSLALIHVPMVEKTVSTSFGDSHVLCCGDESRLPLVLLHAASCGSPIFYPNLPVWSKDFCVYAVDLIGESSKSILTAKMATPADNAKWLDETIRGLKLDRVSLCGLSIGGWTAANYAGFFPEKISRLILLSPVQTFAKMHPTYFFKIMKMGFHPTRENAERYIGWGSAKEAPLPDSIIEQFTISVMNINANASFPKWIKTAHFQNWNMPVLVLFGENEFAFPVQKAVRRARRLLKHLELEIIPGASHLVSVSRPDEVNQRVLKFLRADN